VVIAQEAKDWDLKKAMNLGVVFERVTALAGLKFSEAFQAQLWRWVNNGDGGADEEAASLEATQDAVVQIAPSVLHPSIYGPHARTHTANRFHVAEWT
jgi:hypothetical protein